MAKNIFKQIEEFRIQLELILKDGSYVSDGSNNFKEKYEAIKEIEDYFKSFVWLNHKNTIERLKVFIKANYKVKVAIEMSNEKSKSAYETSIWYSSKKFKEIIGENTVDLIVRDRVDEGLQQFRVNTGKIGLSTLIPDKIVDMYGDANYYHGVISTSDCSAELKVMRQMTYRVLDNVINNKLDKNKLSFLRYVLESSDQRYSKHRVLIYKFLSGEINDLDYLILELKDAEL